MKMNRMRAAVSPALLGALLAALPALAAPPTVNKIRTSVVDTEALYYTKSSYGYTPNGKSFQQDGVVSHNGWQYVTYWDGSRRLCVGRRRLPDGEWDVIHFSDYTHTATDCHNVTTVGVAPADGTIHLSFDHHNSTLHYRVSQKGVATRPEDFTWDASLFGPVRNTLEAGKSISGVTYPRFFTTPGGGVQFWYRTGASGNGDWRISSYDPVAGEWRNLGIVISRSGTYNGSTSRCAYMNGFDYDANGRLHTSWCWRETSSASSNHDLMYAYSDDRGRTWYNSAGEHVATAGSKYIRVDTAGVKVWTIPQNSGLMNTIGQAVDSEGRIHVIERYTPSETGTLGYVHFWRDHDGTWNRTVMPQVGGIGRPWIRMGAQDNAYMIHKACVVTASAASGWTDWAIACQNSHTCGAEPLFDRHLFRKEGILAVYSQESSSPGVPSPLYIFDFEIQDTIQNGPPTVVGCDPPSPVAMVGGHTQEFFVDAADPDGDTLTYRWLLDDQVIPGASSATYAYAPAGTDIGTHGLTAIVMDGTSFPVHQVWTVIVQEGGISATASADPTAGQAPLTVQFTGSASGGSPSGGAPVPVQAVDASAYQDPNVPGNTIDGSLSTRWSAEGDGQWIRFDLGLVIPINGVAVAWYRGDTRKSTFDLDLSEDGTNWVSAYSGQSSGTTLALEEHGFQETSARYVRLTGHGNTSNAWNSVTEVEIRRDGGYRYSWDFGDGATSDEKDPVHTYTEGGVYSAVLTVTDGIGTATDSVSITVAAGSVPPVAEDQSVTTDQDTPVDITLVAVDPDGSGSGNLALGAAVSASSTHDSYSADEINDGDNSTGFSSQWSNANGDMPCWVRLEYGGDITFDRVELYTCAEYELKDFRIQYYGGAAWHDAAVVTGNTRPHLTFALDTPVTGSMVRVYCTAGPDRQSHYARVCELEIYMDATVLTYQIVDPPAHGTLSGTAPNVTYTPDAGYTGPDSFTFKANDGQADSNVATVNITVVGTGANTPPVAQDQSFTIDEDTSLDVTLSATDAEGDALTYTIVEIPGYGELAGTPPNVTYIPDGDYYGTDYFTFKANDGEADSNVATVSIAVAPVEDPPVARDGSSEVASGSSVGITLQAYDVDEDPLTYVIVTSPLNGALSGDDGGNLLTYTPDGGFSGIDTFTFVANDGTSDSNVATVTVSVSGDIVSIVSVSTQRPYSLAPAETDCLYYIDRNYRISSLANELEGAVLVRTANNDKYVTEPDHLVLRIGEEATISVCYDRRWSALPGWLEDGTWTARGGIVSVTDRAASPLEVFEKIVQPGDITLGANRSDGAAGSRSNYVVIVRPSSRTGTEKTGTEFNTFPVTNYVVGPLAPDEWLEENDTDGDGLSDDFEVEQGLDPENPDTNGDGVFDEYEPDVDGRDLFDVQEETDAAPNPELVPGDDGGSGGGCFLRTVRPCRPNM